MRKDGSYIKKQRLGEISRIIAKGLTEHGKVSFSQLLSAVQFHIGLTKPRAEEYVELCLANKRDWVRNDDTITVVESEKA